MPESELRGYHTFETVESHLNQIVANFPKLASLETYGHSKEGRPLYALRMAGKVVGNKPEIMLTAATHGDELITVEVLFGLMDALTAGYGQNARLTSILDNHVIYFLPVINPDGYIRRSRYANGVDPNRNYPWLENPDRTPNECIKGVIDFFQRHDFRASIDFHAAMGLFMYPWAYTQDAVDVVDETALENVTSRMGATNGYGHGQISRILYVAEGSSADYYYCCAGAPWPWGLRSQARRFRRPA